MDERLPVRLCGCMIVFMDPVLRTALLQEGVFLLAILVLIKWGMMKVSEYCRLEQVECVETGHVRGACTREEPQSLKTQSEDCGDCLTQIKG